MKMHIGGEWTDRDDKLEVMNPFDGSIIDTVPKASATDVAQAVETAEAGAAIMRDMPAYERYQILHRAAEIMEQRLDDLGQTITKEEGKILPEGLGEAGAAAMIAGYGGTPRSQLLLALAGGGLMGWTLGMVVLGRLFGLGG